MIEPMPGPGPNQPEDFNAENVAWLKPIQEFYHAGVLMPLADKMFHLQCVAQHDANFEAKPMLDAMEIACLHQALAFAIHALDQHKAAGGNNPPGQPPGKPSMN